MKPLRVSPVPYAKDDFVQSWMLHIPLILQHFWQDVADPQDLEFLEASDGLNPGGLWVWGSVGR